MKDFNGGRKPGGFGGRSGSSDRGGFGGRSSGGDRGGSRSFGAKSFDRPTMYKAVCSECGNNCEVPFQPTGSKPVLCSPCFGEQQGNSRDFGSRDRDFGSRDNSRERSFEKKMFTATCEGCGDKCEVPFKPTEGKSVFCDSCFRGNDVAPKGKPAFASDKTQEQFAAINAKLDQIIKALKVSTKPEKIKEIEDVLVSDVEEVVAEIEDLAKPEVKVEKATKTKAVKETAVKKTTKKKA